ncbi:MAG: NADH-quinone oxidoreductase subunit J [Candidatus Parvarchaeota archaeon]|jgi:NADH-quinone oxidoreductase subunit J|nr:NADH-quinone oxidoreductase subunit J [Candidatus Parvarchaeota archaeon]
MDISTVGFFALSAVLILFAILIVMSKKLVHSLVFLFMFIISMASMFIYLNAVFLSIAELIIYNGGIVLLLAIGISLMPEGSMGRKGMKYLIFIPVAVIVLLSFLASRYPASQASSPMNYSNLGMILFQNYGIILVVLAIAGVASLLSALYIVGERS